MLFKTVLFGQHLLVLLTDDSPGLLPVHPLVVLNESHEDLLPVAPPT